MDDVTREEFDTEDEAVAFTEGIDTAVTLLDSDFLIYEPPYLEGDTWVVEVRIVRTTKMVDTLAARG